MNKSCQECKLISSSTYFFLLFLTSACYSSSNNQPGDQFDDPHEEMEDLNFEDNLGEDTFEIIVDDTPELHDIDQENEIDGIVEIIDDEIDQNDEIKLANYGDSCMSNDECYTKIGIGECIDMWEISFCSLFCDQEMTENEGVCESYEAAGEASGICWNNLCFLACGYPATSLATNGCVDTLLACYNLSDFPFDFFYYQVTVMPIGICLPACASSENCMEWFGMPLYCDLVSGTCQ